MTNEEEQMAFISDPLIVEIFLYSNNYKDRLLIGELKERANLVKIGDVSENAFFVQTLELEHILHTTFRKDISNFASTSSNEINSSVTSVYFIDNILRTFPNLKYIKVNISDSQIYSRKVEDKIIFDYKIIHSKIDLANILTDADLFATKELLKDIGIYKVEPFERKPYFEIYARDLTFMLNNYANSFEDENAEEVMLVDGLVSLIGPKLENDNPILLIVIER